MRKLALVVAVVSAVLLLSFIGGLRAGPLQGQTLFTVNPPPVVTTIRPTSGPAGQVVAICGANFAPPYSLLPATPTPTPTGGTPTPTPTPAPTVNPQLPPIVMFGGVQAVAIAFDPAVPNQVIAVAPPGFGPGTTVDITVSVTVTTSQIVTTLVSATGPADQFTYTAGAAGPHTTCGGNPISPPPVITSISESNGPVGQLVAICGKNFPASAGGTAATNANLAVVFGPAAVIPLNVTVVPVGTTGTTGTTGATPSAANELLVVVPPQPLPTLGPLDVTVLVNGLASSQVPADQFTYTAGPIQPPVSCDPNNPTPIQNETVTFQAGWNLVSGPAGTVLTGAAGPVSTFQPGGTSNTVCPITTAMTASSLYTFQPGDTSYEVCPVTTPLRANIGYWAFFPTVTTVTLPDVTTPPAASVGGTLTSSFFMIGNPSDATMTISGATVAFTYNPANGQYVQSTTLAPGQGAWVQSRRAVTLTPATQSAQGR